MVPKVQTTSAKNAENGVSWARWSTFWAHRCLARCVCSRVSPLFRVSTRYVARELLDTHVNPETCTWAGLPTHISSASRAGERAQQVIGPTCTVTGTRVTTATTRSNVARNSPEDISGFEIGSLIFRGFKPSANEALEELRATLGREGCVWGVPGGGAWGKVWGSAWGCIWGASGAQLEAQVGCKSSVFAGGKERWAGRRGGWEGEAGGKERWAGRRGGWEGEAGGKKRRVGRVGGNG